MKISSNKYRESIESCEEHLRSRVGSNDYSRHFRSAPFSFFSSYLAQVNKAFADVTSSLEGVTIAFLKEPDSDYSSPLSTQDAALSELIDIYEDMELEAKAAIESYKEIGGFLIQVASALFNAIIFGDTSKCVSSGYLIQDQLLGDFRKNLLDRLVVSEIITQEEIPHVDKLLQVDMRNNLSFVLEHKARDPTLYQDLSQAISHFDQDSARNLKFLATTGQDKTVIQLLAKKKPVDRVPCAQFFGPLYKRILGDKIGSKASAFDCFDRIPASQREAVRERIETKLSQIESQDQGALIEKIQRGFFVTQDMTADQIDEVLKLVCSLPRQRDLHALQLFAQECISSFAKKQVDPLGTAILTAYKNLANGKEQWKQEAFNLPETLRNDLFQCLGISQTADLDLSELFMEKFAKGFSVFEVLLGVGWYLKHESLPCVFRPFIAVEIDLPVRDKIINLLQKTSAKYDPSNGLGVYFLLEAGSCLVKEGMGIERLYILEALSSMDSRNREKVAKEVLKWQIDFRNYSEDKIKESLADIESNIKNLRSSGK